MADDDDDLQRRLAAYGRRRRATGYPDEEEPRNVDPYFDQSDPNARDPDPGMEAHVADTGVPMPDAREALRRMGGGRAEATGYPPGGTRRQGEVDPYGPGRYPPSKEELEEIARNDYIPEQPVTGRQAYGEPGGPQMGAGGYPPEAIGMPNQMADTPQGGPVGGMPGQPPQPGMPLSAYGQTGQQQFNPSQFVQGLAPPPPIRIFRNGVEGGEEFGSTNTQSPMMGTSLKALEDIILKGPEFRDPHTGRLTTNGQAAYRLLLHQAGETALHQMQQGQQGQMEQAPPSANQAQIMARLDAGEDKLNQMQASGYFGENGHNSQEYFEAMAQIAQQRQAIKAKELPPPPTPQETFDKQAIHLPNGMLMTPTYGAKGEQTGWKEHPNADAALTEKLLTANPGLSPYGAAQHIALMRAAAAGHPVTPEQEAEINRKYPLSGKPQKEVEFKPQPITHYRAAAIKEWDALHPPQHNAEGKKESQEPPPDWYVEQQAQTLARKDKEHWQGMHGKTSQDAESPQGGNTDLQSQRAKFLDTKVPAWKQKAGRNVGIVDSVEKAVRAYPGGPMTMPPNVRDDYVQALKFIKANIDPSVNVPDPSKIGAVDETKP